MQNRKVRIKLCRVSPVKLQIVTTAQYSHDTDFNQVLLLYYSKVRQYLHCTIVPRDYDATVLYYSHQNQIFHVNNIYDKMKVDPGLCENQINRCNRMVYYAIQKGECRRAVILRYFDESADAMVCVMFARSILAQESETYLNLPRRQFNVYKD